MNATKLKKILDKHSAWLRDEKGGVRADLSGADLRSADLRSAYLSGADLSGAYLSGADLSGADLRSADLRSADLSGAYLSGAYLSGADLSGADLSGAYLRSAYLSGADLSGAYLSGADLSGAKYIVRLPVGDPRIYDPVAVEKDGEWIIYSGCRCFTIAQAKKHWGKTYDGDRDTGDRYLYGLNWLKRYPLRKGAKRKTKAV